MKSLTLSFSLIVLCCIPNLLNAASSKIIRQETPGWVTHLPQDPNKKRAIDTVSGYILNISEEQIHLEKRTTYTRAIREIVSDEGTKDASAISVSFNPSYQTVAFHKVVLWRNGVAYDKLNLNEINTEPEESEPIYRKYSNQHTAYLSL